MNSMRKIELDIVALSHSVANSNNYAIVLSEVGGNRRLPIVIGAPEAQSIAVAMERMTPSRPLTHDLFKNTLETFNIKLSEVVINNLTDGIFYARLVCDFNGSLEEVDSRTSDALALAVRYDCPIFTYEFILDAAGVVIDDGGAPATQRSRAQGNEETLASYSTEQLSQMLDKVLSEEKYERAAAIRDELNRRKG